MEQVPLWQASPPGNNNGTANNALLERTVVPSYVCPSRGDNVFQSLSNGGRQWFRVAYVATYGDAPEAPGSPYVHTPGGMGVWNFEARLRMVDVTDGTSNTIMVGERYTATSRYLQDDWGGEPLTRGHGWGVARRCRGVPVPDKLNLTAGAVPADGNGPANERLGSAHVDGCGVVLGDGSVRFLRYNIDVVPYRDMCKRNDGNVPTNQP
jgi:hypothetical protein